MKKTLATAFVCVALLAAIPAFASVTVGLPADVGTGNCFPFGCAYGGEYQQVYNSGQFPGSITITDLQFFNTQVNFGATSTNTGNFAISLSTTSADWNTLSPTYANNIGANNTLVFSGSISQPWAFGDTLTINLTTPFTYNPGAGNLLMDVVVSGSGDAGGPIYFDTNGYNGGSFNGNTFLGRVYGAGVVNSGYGLVTGFSTGVSTVPEPGSLALFGSGVIGLMAVVRRKINL
jgi:hypothetical protein